METLELFDERTGAKEKNRTSVNTVNFHDKNIDI